jgi:hypothetical protein
MSKPQVLVFIDWYKPYYKAGGPVRSMVNLVDHLADRIDFHIVTGDRDYMATTNEADVPVDQWVNGESGERVMYVPPSKRSTATWRQLLKEKKIRRGVHQWPVFALVHHRAALAPARFETAAHRCGAWHVGCWPDEAERTQEATLPLCYEGDGLLQGCGVPGNE